MKKNLVSLAVFGAFLALGSQVAMAAPHHANCLNVSGARCTRIGLDVTDASGLFLDFDFLRLDV